MQALHNRWRGTGLPPAAGLAEGRVSTDAGAPLALLRRCPAAAPTPLQALPELAHALGVGELWLKDERSRMGLGSFKALGAAYVIARAAARRADASGAPAPCERMRDVLADTVYACASAGNHGLSVAAGARVFGARAVIFLADSVPRAFAERLQRLDAEVVRPGGDYAASMRAAAAAADENSWVLLSDSSWLGYTELPTGIMEGYLVMGQEVIEAMETPPTHVLLQAGVGGMAAAMAALLRDRWGDAPLLIVVEPEAAPALIESIRAGRPVATRGPASNMGRLDCKEPSHLALAELARAADWYLTIGDDEAAAGVELLAAHGIATTPSGAAGVAALPHAKRADLGLSAASRVLAFVSEGREDAP